MKAILKKTLIGAGGGLAVLILLTALAATAARLLLPHADGLRAEVLARVGEMLGADLEVGAFDLRLRGLTPELAFADARLLDPAAPADPRAPLLCVRELRIDLDLLASIAARRPRIETITLAGAELRLRRGDDGRLAILGLDALDGDDAGALDFFLREGRFRLVESTLHWDGALGSPAAAGSRPRLRIEALEFANHGQRHRLRARVRTLGEPRGRLLLQAALRGPPRAPGGWSGALHLDWRGAGPGPLPAGLLPDGLALGAAASRIESWNRLEQGRLTESLSRIAIDGLWLQGGDRRHRLGDLGTLARWRRETGGWRLQLAELALPGTQAPPTSALLRLQRGDAEPGSLYAAVGTLDLAALGRALAPAAEALPWALQPIARARLHGRVSGLAGRVALPPRGAAAAAGGLGGLLGAVSGAAAESRPGEASAGPHTEDAAAAWRLRARVEDLAIAGARGLPPFSGLDLTFEAGPAGGRAALDATGVDLDLRPFFAKMHRFTRLRGRLGWRLLPAGSIHLWTRALEADTDDLQSLTRLSLCAHPSGASPFIDLHTQVRDARVSGLRRWLPAGVMDDRLEDWLLRAIVAGRVESGDLLLRGRLDRFPFDDHDGRFLLVLRALDGVVDYGVAQNDALQEADGLRSAERGPPPRWPPLRELAATLRFENRSLDIEVASAELLNTEVRSGWARMPNLYQPHYLRIGARGQGPLADGMHLLETSPLAAHLGGLPRVARVSGRSTLALELGVPLSKGLPFTYDGELIWPEPGRGEPPRTLTLIGPELRFTGISGRLGFDNAGVRAEGLRAARGEQPLRIDVETIDGGAEARTEITLAANTPVERIAAWLPSPLWRFADGALDWRLRLDLRNRDASEPNPPIGFTLGSDLRGLSLSLPAPLGKDAGEAQALRLGGRYRNTWPLRLEAGLGALGALLELDRSGSDGVRLRRLALGLDGVPQALPAQPGIAVSGRLKRLALGPWLRWSGANAAVLEAPEGGPTLLPMSVGVDELRVGGLTLTGVDAEIAPREDGWHADLMAEEIGRCTLALPAAGSGGALRAQLERLDLRPLAEDAGERPTSARAEPLIDPRRLVSLQLEVDELRYGEDVLGRLRVDAESTAEGLDFTELTLAGSDVRVRGQGRWHSDASGYIETAAEIDLHSDAFGELLRRAGFYSALAGAPADLTLDLTWPGGPGDLTLRLARGTLKLDIGSGRMLAMEPGVGRMLGILNTGALTRRLSLDFSDVFSDGFSFDAITGEIAIGSAQARIRALSVQAPPADIRITGTTDLVEGTLDQYVEVTPKIGTGVALAGAVAGGPVLGAAMFLADKVTGGGVDRLGRYAYRVTGPWREPRIRRVDTTGSPSFGNLFADDEAASGAEGAAASGHGESDQAGSGRDGARQRPAADNPFLDGF